MRHFYFTCALLFSCNAWSAEVTCLVADFKASLNIPASVREAAAHQWIKERGAECSYEQLTAIKNNLGNWMGVANSYRVSVQLQHHLERYYVAKNQWSESLYTSKAAYIAPYTSRALTAETNVIVSPPPISPGGYGQPYPQPGYDPNNFYQQQPDYNYSAPYPNNNGYPNDYQTTPQDTYPDPNSDW